MKNSVSKLIEKYSPFYDNISVYITSGVSKSVQLSDGKPESTEYKDGITIQVRAVKDKKQIASGFTGFDIGKLETFLEESKTAAEHLPSDEFCYMPDYENFDADIMVDKSFDDCSVETLSEMAKELTGSAMNADGRIKSVKQASVSASKSVTDIITSFGASLRRERTYFSATAYVIANDGDDESDAYEHQVKTSLAELDINELGIEAGRKACELLDAKRVKTDKYHILFSSDVMADFIELLLELTDGDNVYKKRSMLAGKLEQKIASSCFTLTDDPSLKNAAGSYTFDDEGQKASKTEIIKDGILKSFLHNSYTSKALGMGNSANASLGSGGNMSIDSSNVILESTTDKSIDEVCSEYLRVTEVMGMHTADPISGDFSVGISGVYFKDGKAVYPFREAVLSGNLKDLLNGITHVFSNKKTFGSITTADALFDKMTVSGE